MIGISILVTTHVHGLYMERLYEKARQEILNPPDYYSETILEKHERSLYRYDEDLYMTLKYFYAAKKQYYRYDNAMNCHDTIRLVDSSLLNEEERAEYDRLVAAGDQAYEEYWEKQKEASEKRAQEVAEWQEERAEAEARRIEELKTGVPAYSTKEIELGMSSLGEPSEITQSGSSKIYKWYDGERLIFVVFVNKDGEITNIYDYRDIEFYGRDRESSGAPTAASVPVSVLESGGSSGKKNETSGSKDSGKKNDPYNAKDYNDFDDFYDDYYDDFIDIDEAEDYYYGW